MTDPVTCRCGKPLRDPVSVARGLGPVCARRLNGKPPAIRAPATEHGPMDGQTEIPIQLTLGGTP